MACRSGSTYYTYPGGQFRWRMLAEKKIGLSGTTGGMFGQRNEISGRSNPVTARVNSSKVSFIVWHVLGLIIGGLLIVFGDLVFD